MATLTAAVYQPPVHRSHSFNRSNSTTPIPRSHSPAMATKQTERTQQHLRSSTSMPYLRRNGSGPCPPPYSPLDEEFRDEDDADIEDDVEGNDEEQPPPISQDYHEYLRSVAVHFDYQNDTTEEKPQRRYRRRRNSKDHSPSPSRRDILPLLPRRSRRPRRSDDDREGTSSENHSSNVSLRSLSLSRSQSRAQTPVSRAATPVHSRTATPSRSRSRGSSRAQYLSSSASSTHTSSPASSNLSSSYSSGSSFFIQRATTPVANFSKKVAGGFSFTPYLGQRQNPSVSSFGCVDGLRGTPEGEDAGNTTDEDPGCVRVMTGGRRASCPSVAGDDVTTTTNVAGGWWIRRRARDDGSISLAPDEMLSSSPGSTIATTTTTTTSTTSTAGGWGKVRTFVRRVSKAVGGAERRESGGSAGSPAGEKALEAGYEHNGYVFGGSGGFGRTRVHYLDAGRGFGSVSGNKMEGWIGPD